jgi:hypothetical protein
MRYGAQIENDKYVCARAQSEETGKARYSSP